MCTVVRYVQGKGVMCTMIRYGQGKFAAVRNPGSHFEDIQMCSTVCSSSSYLVDDSGQP